MADTGMKDRVKGLFSALPSPNVPVGQRAQESDPIAQQQALQVLELAQRTADEHVAGAWREAEQIGTDARAKAEQIVRHAEAHAQARQREAEQMLADAQAEAERVARDVQVHADKVTRDAEEVLSEARTKADEMAMNAQASAEELNRQASQRYDDVVGSLAAKREALQGQIEALEMFDGEYRARLTSFMQHQLRALWVDQPRVGAEEVEQPVASRAALPAPVQAGQSGQS